jgi:hypothetical protein
MIDFLVVCGAFGVDPGVALENDRVSEALEAGASQEELTQIFSEEF